MKPQNETTHTPVTRSLSILLADTYTLAVMTQKAHWNVQGPHFMSLHEMFGEQYERLSEAVDEIAERIRALGVLAPGSFEEFTELRSLSPKAIQGDQNQLIQALGEGHEFIAERIKPEIPKFQEAGDETSADLLIQRIEVHEKEAWFLRSHLVKF